MIIFNRIAECDDGRHRTIDPAGVSVACVHRIDVGETAAEISKRFRTDLASYTGGEMPYPLILRRDGAWEQALRLYDYAPHARRWSRKAIGLGVVGDFRKHWPTVEQEIGLYEMLQPLRDLFGGPEKIVAHEELPGSSSDPDKACPGPLLSVAKFRTWLTNDPEPRRSPAEARAELERLGVIF